MRKSKEDYKMVQMDAELHKYLKEYCQRHGFSMSGFVAALLDAVVALAAAEVADAAALVALVDAEVADVLAAFA